MNRPKEEDDNSPPVQMYPVFYLNDFLPGKESILSRIAQCEQAYELIAFGGMDDFLYFPGLVSYWDMEHGAQPFVGGGKQHVLQCTPR